MATNNHSPDPSPAKTRADLAWFQERRKRWENAPRNRVVPVSQVGSPVKELTSVETDSAFPEQKGSKPELMDSKEPGAFGVKKQIGGSSGENKTSLDGAFSLLSTGSIRSGTLEMGGVSESSSKGLFSASPSFGAPQSNKVPFGSLSGSNTTTGSANPNLFCSPSNDGSPSSTSHDVKSTSSLFGACQPRPQSLGVKGTDDELKQELSSVAASPSITTGSSMSSPLFGSAISGNMFGDVVANKSNPFELANKDGKTSSPFTFTTNSKSTSNSQMQTPLFGASSTSGGLFGAAPRNKGTKPNPFALAKQIAPATETAAPSVAAGATTPTLGFGTLSSKTVSSATPFASRGLFGSSSEEVVGLSLASQVLSSTTSVGGGKATASQGTTPATKEQELEKDVPASSSLPRHSSEQSHKDRLIEFYKKYNPDKLDKVDDTLASFKGKEDVLFRKLEDKYVKGKNGVLPPGGQGPTCFLDFSIGGADVMGRVTVKLYQDKTPLACENFRSLCTGEKGTGRSGKPLCYKFSKVHRVVPNFCVQLGDFTKANGTGGESIYPPNSEHGDMWGKFKDEVFLQHARRGLLSMANSGPNTNSSQFFFTLKALPHLDGKHVVFGEILEGMDIVEKMASIPTDTKQFPKESIVVENCGELRGDKEISAAVAANKTSPFGSFGLDSTKASLPFGTFGSSSNNSSSPFSTFSSISSGTTTGKPFGSAAPFATFSPANTQTATTASPSIFSFGSNNASSQFGGFGGSAAQATPFASFGGNSSPSPNLSFGPPRK